MRAAIFGWLLYRVILPRCDHVFVQSQRMKDDLSDMGADPAKMTPVPMGIDPGIFLSRKQPVIPQAGNSGPLVLGYLGTLGAQRKLDILIDTLSLLCDGGLDARLMLVGGSDNPEDRINLERRAFELGVSNRLEITGMVPRGQALELMQNVDVALSPFYPTMILQSTSPDQTGGVHGSGASGRRQPAPRAAADSAAIARGRLCALGCRSFRAWSAVARQHRTSEAARVRVSGVARGLSIIADTTRLLMQWKVSISS